MEILSGRKPKRIMIVDDETEFRSTLEWTLARNQYEPIGANNVAHAKELFSSGHIDAIICDINMPDMSGIAFLRWIRERSAVPVILMTGYLEPQQGDAAAELGVNGILTKPFPRKELVECLATCFSEALSSSG